jgi:predicted nucleic acid-binding protein
VIVIADTTPLNYLILIESIDILPRLYGLVTVPQAVFDELRDAEAPSAVRRWVASAPAWLEVRQASGSQDSRLRRLGPGEREVIVLAEQLQADSLIVDDLAARQEANRRNLHVIGTLAVLYEAAGAGLLDFPGSVQQLVQAGFHASPRLIRLFLDLHARRLTERTDEASNKD